MLCNDGHTIRVYADRFWLLIKSGLAKVANDGNTKIIKTCAIIIFALMLGNALAGESMKLSENDSGKTVEIGVDDELEVVLPGKPTTGYVWEVSSLDTRVLSQGEANFIANDKAIGSGGMEIIKFHAIAAGTSVVRLIFHRPFERNMPQLKTFEVTVIVKK